MGLWLAINDVVVVMYCRWFDIWNYWLLVLLYMLVCVLQGVWLAVTGVCLFVLWVGGCVLVVLLRLFVSLMRLGFVDFVVLLLIVACLLLGGLELF